MPLPMAGVAAAGIMGGGKPKATHAAGTMDDFGFKDSAKGLTDYGMKTALRTQVDLMQRSMRISDKLRDGFLDYDYIIRILCSPITFPLGMIHSVLPMSICRPKGVSDTKESSQQKQNTGTFTGVSDELSGSILGNNDKLKSIQNAGIFSTVELLQEFKQESFVSISTNQNATIKCPSDVLDKNPFMKRMADVKPSDENIWKPAVINLEKCSNGQKLKYKDDQGNPINDSCEEYEYIDENNNTVKVPSKGGWIVEYYDGTTETGVQELDKNNKRIIRWIYGCCPVADQKATIKVTQIKEI
jgi:hypothetical protein